mmetsp:Transcript_25314/g.79642  ORF Transcript_25314/g.79642 Transcript_25314/m.79642 type:complete len:432 (-) Transcript_25314:328-1623(-)
MPGRAAATATSRCRKAGLSAAALLSIAKSPPPASESAASFGPHASTPSRSGSDQPMPDRSSSASFCSARGSGLAEKGSTLAAAGPNAAAGSRAVPARSRAVKLGACGRRRPRACEPRPPSVLPPSRSSSRFFCVPAASRTISIPSGPTPHRTSLSSASSPARSERSPAASRKAASPTAFPERSMTEREANRLPASASPSAPISAGPAPARRISNATSVRLEPRSGASAAASAPSALPDTLKATNAPLCASARARGRTADGRSREASTSPVAAHSRTHCSAVVTPAASSDGESTSSTSTWPRAFACIVHAACRLPSTSQTGGSSSSGGTGRPVCSSIRPAARECATQTCSCSSAAARGEVATCHGGSPEERSSRSRPGDASSSRTSQSWVTCSVRKAAPPATAKRRPSEVSASRQGLASSVACAAKRPCSPP